MSKRKKPEEHSSDSERKVKVTRDVPLDTTNEETKPFSLIEFKENCVVTVKPCQHEQEDKKKDQNKACNECFVFDIKGVDAPVANALRRILIAEVPTMAFSTLQVDSNSSIIQDEVFAHRLGLVPIYADPRQFKPRSVVSKRDGIEKEDEVLIFRLKQSGSSEERQHEKVAKKGEANKPRQAVDPTYFKVYTKDLVWEPIGNQKERFENDPPRPVDDDILLVKLAPGQAIDFRLICELGIGKTHAKFSPVATATYRLLPDVQVVKELTGEAADALKKICPTKVFDIEDVGHKAVVSDSSRCTMCRECIRRADQPFSGAVELGRVRDHFCFSVESTGALPAVTLVDEALKILQEKCTRVRKLLQRGAGTVRAP